MSQATEPYNPDYDPLLAQRATGGFGQLSAYRGKFDLVFAEDVELPITYQIKNTPRKRR